MAVGFAGVLVGAVAVVFAPPVVVVVFVAVFDDVCPGDVAPPDLVSEPCNA